MSMQVHPHDLLLGAAFLLAISSGNAFTPPVATMGSESDGPIHVDTTPVVHIPIGEDKIFKRANQALLLDDGSVVYIGVHGSQLLEYGSTGKLKWRLKASPAGTGGFETFSSLMHAPSGELLAWDGWKSVLYRIDKHSRPSPLMKVMRPPRTKIAGGSDQESLEFHGRFDNGHYLATVLKNSYWRRGVYPESTTVYRVDEKGKIFGIGKVLVMKRYNHDAGEHIESGDLPFGRHGRIAVLGNDWYYTDGSTFAIERHRADGTLIKTIATPRPRSPLSQSAMIESRRRTLRATDSMNLSSMVKTLTWMPYPDSLPAYSELLSDTRGMLWAQHGTPPGEPEQWTVFSRNGRGRTEVTLPADLRVLDISSDALLGYHLKPDGTGELLVYGIERE